MFSFFNKKVKSSDLFNYKKIQEYKEILKNGQIVPLNMIINDTTPLIVKFSNNLEFDFFKKNPFIETSPFFIEFRIENKYSFVCYLFVIISKNNTNSIHELIFDLTNKQMVEDCEKIICSTKNSIILLSENNTQLIDYELPQSIAKRRKEIIKSLIENSDSKEKLEFSSIVQLLQNLEEDVHSSYKTFKELSRKSFSSVLKIELTSN